MLNHKTLFIDGRWRNPSGQGIAEVINPATEEVAGSVPLGDELDVENAVAAARRAFDSWSRTPSSVRAGYIRALAEQLRARADEMAAVITTELGMPVQWCRSVQVDGPITGLEQYVELYRAAPLHRHAQFSGDDRGHLIGTIAQLIGQGADVTGTHAGRCTRP